MSSKISAEAAALTGMLKPCGIEDISAVLDVQD